MNRRLKPVVLIVGPTQSGKTTIADFIAGSLMEPIPEYEPTVGVRIREVLVPANRPIPGEGDKIEIELWDVSGDRRFSFLTLHLYVFLLPFDTNRYQDGWPAIWKDADAVILVYNGDEPQQEKELEFWYFNRYIIVFMSLHFL